MFNARLLKIRRKVVDFIRYYRSSDLNCINVARSALDSLGMQLYPKRHSSRLVHACKTFHTKFPLGLAIYNALVGFPMMGITNIGKDLMVTIESIATVFIAILVVCANFCVLCRFGQLQRMNHAMEVANEYSLKMPRRPEFVLRESREECASLGRLLFVIIATMPLLLLTLPKMIQERTLVTNVWYPFDPTAFPIYEILLVLTSWVHVQAVTVMLIQGILMIGMMSVVAGHFRLLAHNLKNLHEKDKRDVNQGKRSQDLIPEYRVKHFKGPGSKAFRESGKNSGKLKICVQYHCSIIKLIKEIKMTWDFDMVVMGLSVLVPNGLTIALIAFTEEIEAKTITFVIVIIFGNIIMGWLFKTTENIANESDAVRQALYEGEWFDQPESFKRSMRIIMSRCNQSVVLNAGGMMKYTMETYFGLMKLTYSYCMALWAYLKHEREIDAGGATSRPKLHFVSIN